MKMIKFNIFFLLFALFSCKKEIKNNNLNLDSLIPKETAIIVAKKFNTNIFNSSKMSQNYKNSEASDSLAVYNNGRQILNTITLYDNSLPAAYIINYADNAGYLIVAADKNARTILAFVEQGNYTDTLAVSEGLKEWVQDAVAEIKRIRTNNLLATTTIQNEWNLYSGGNVTYLTQPPYNPAENCDYYYINTYGPYLQSHWSQGCGFNDLLPSCSNNNCNHMLVGCVATAMAQVMYYYKWPNYYNWNLMTNDNGTIEASRLCRDAGICVGMNYGCSSSSALGMRVPGALWMNFNYKSSIDRCGFYDRTADMWSNLKTSKPIIVEGRRSLTEGHMWVCDGMQDIQWCTREDGQNWYGANTLYHMNWGWGYNAIGWFRYGAFNTGGIFNYNTGVKAIINIIPNR